MKKIPFIIRLVILSIIGCQFCFWTKPTDAQFGQGFTDAIVFSMSQKAADRLEVFYKHYEHLPQSTAELDNALRSVYGYISSDPDSTNKQITSSGSYRVLDNLRIAIDGSIRNPPIQQWKHSPPETWNAPANTITILSDGESQFVVWCASLSGNVLRDSNGNAMYIYKNLQPSP